MVTIGTDRETNRAAVALAERGPDVWASVGIHPHDAAEATEADFEAMERLARGSARVVGAGRDGARLLPRPLAARRAGARLPPPARHGPALRQAGRRPLPRRARGDARDPRRGARGRGGRRHALLLRRRGGRQALPRPRPDDLARGAGDLQERARAAGRRPLRARRSPGGRDRLPVSCRPTPTAGSATSPRTWPSPPRTWPSCAASTPEALGADRSPTTRARLFRIPTRYA